LYFKNRDPLQPVRVLTFRVKLKQTIMDLNAREGAEIKIDLDVEK
jgi:hypothetical protein